MRDRCQVLIVGAGPAGLSAASFAGLAAMDVLVLDDNPRVGGQIWRHPSLDLPKWAKDFERLQVRFSPETRALGAIVPGKLLAENRGRRIEIDYDSLILATGASERFLPFPGWTLPNVVGVGGLQALVKGGLNINGKRVVVAGTGPLLLAVGAHLRHHGANIEGIVEQASLTSLVGFAPALLSDLGKAGQALRLRRDLWRVPYRTSAFVVRADGDKRVERVLIRTSKGDRWFECEYLAIGYDLTPNTELAQSLGCQIVDGFVTVDRSQRTSKASIYAAGEITGIGGAVKAERQGAIAGATAGGQKRSSEMISTARTERFAESLNRAFALRPELFGLAEPDTIVCRCEDVRLRDLDPYGSWREAKLQTRCGMGPCQGRVCGPILEALKGWKRDSVRPPVVACRVGSLIQGEASKE